MITTYHVHAVTRSGRIIPSPVVRQEYAARRVAEHLLATLNCLAALSINSISPRGVEVEIDRWVIGSPRPSMIRN